LLLLIAPVAVSSIWIREPVELLVIVTGEIQAACWDLFFLVSPARVCVVLAPSVLVNEATTLRAPIKLLLAQVVMFFAVLTG
jgi:hypothetical protein